MQATTRGPRVPHLFVNRPRLHDLTSDDADLRAQFRWETLNAVIYKIGGVTFIVGSILFFPQFEEYGDLGVWTFFGGSLLYLVVTGHDLAEVRRRWRGRAEPDPVGLAPDRRVRRSRTRALPRARLSAPSRLRPTDASTWDSGALGHWDTGTLGHWGIGATRGG